MRMPLILGSVHCTTSILLNLTLVFHELAVTGTFRISAPVPPRAPVRIQQSVTLFWPLAAFPRDTVACVFTAVGKDQWPVHTYLCLEPPKSGINERMLSGQLSASTFSRTAS